MLTMPQPLSFALMSLGLLLTPGPTNTLLAVSGASAGLRRSWPLIFAESAGYLLAIHLLSFLMGPFVQQSSNVQTGLRLVLALYIFWLAAGLWRSNVILSQTSIVTPARVFVVTLLNPKALVFAFVILPPLTGRWMESFPWLIGLSVMIMGASVCWISLGAALSIGKNVRLHFIARLGAIVLTSFALVMLVGGLRR